MEVVVVVGILFVIALIFAAISASSHEKKQASALAVIPDFRPTISFIGVIGGRGIAIDPDHQKFAVVAGRAGTRVYEFRNLVQVEILRNGTSMQKTNRGSQAAGAVVGAVLLGPMGLLLGGLTGSKRSVEKITKLSLKLYVDDLRVPVEEIVFFEGSSKPDGIMVSGAAKSLDEWYGRFQTILSRRAEFLEATSQTHSSHSLPSQA